MTRKNILIADDDHDMVASLAIRCRQLGLGVQTAYDGMSALARLDAGPPDLAILDIDMPLGDGLSICEVLPLDDKLSSIPIIILTGFSDVNTIHNCRSVGAQYVHKTPDFWSRIEPLIREILGPEDLPESSNLVAGSANRAL